MSEYELLNHDIADCYYAWEEDRVKAEEINAHLDRLFSITSIDTEGNLEEISEILGEIYTSSAAFVQNA